MSNLQKLITELSNLTVLEAAELSKLLEESWGVSAAAPVASASAAPMGGSAEAAEKTEFDVILTAIGDRKIELIKTVREITGLGLKEAKDLVDQAGPNNAIKKGVTKAESEQLKTQLEGAGAAVEIK